MTRLRLERGLTLAALSLLIYSFASMYKTAGLENAQFEKKITAGRAYMYVARAINEPEKCDQKLIPHLKEWDAKTGVPEFTFQDAKVIVRPRAGDPSPEFVKAEMILISEAGQKALPVDLLMGPDSKPVQCKLNIEAVRFQLPGSVMNTPQCVQPQQTPYWYVRCPAGYFLNKQSNPGEVVCCPLEG